METFAIEECKLPKEKKKRINKKYHMFIVACDIYARKYKALHCKTPSFVFNGPFVSVDGKDGVTFKRLVELTKQLDTQLQIRGGK